MRTLLLRNGDLVFERGALEMVEGPKEVVQSCRIILGTRKGEWFLNPDFGLTFDVFLGKSPNQDRMEDELRAALAQEPRIRTVDEITITEDRSARTLSVTFTATGVDGGTISEEVTIGA